MTMTKNNDNKAENTIQSSNTSAGAQNLPKSIVLDKWKDSGFTWQGKISPTQFSRLAQVLDTSVEQQPLELDCRLEKTQGVLWLDFDIQGEISLTCQRCLAPYALDVTSAHHIALLEDEAQASILDDEVDYVLLDEITEDQRGEILLPLANILEDEILLDVPLSPKHEDCEMATEQVGELPEEENENPFAALAALKGKLQ